MPDVNLVVARYTNGQVVKGSTQDFFPDRVLFHVQEPGGAGTVPVKMADLKAVFFVKDLVGNPEHVKSREFAPVDPALALGKRIAVLFKDGELLLGYTHSYTAGRTGFWMTPVDRGNNTRIFVVSAAAQQVRVGPAADELARTAPPPVSRLPRSA